MTQASRPTKRRQLELSAKTLQAVICIIIILYNNYCDYYDYDYDYMLLL